MSVPSWMMRPIMMTSPSNSLLMDDDPGIMSEAETSSTGFRRGSKQRSSLPVVRTPSKTMERPLGLVFLQYRNETKRALLPNEITTFDTVRALFVRSFAHHLSMEYFDSHSVSIYILDPEQDTFYELEDLRDVRDRSILRLYETEGPAGSLGGCFPTAAFPQPQQFLGGVINNSSAAGGPSTGMTSPPRQLMPMNPSPGSLYWDPDLSYFSEPEFDSEQRYRHAHKSAKQGSMNNGCKPPPSILSGPYPPISYGFSNGGLIRPSAYLGNGNTILNPSAGLVQQPVLTSPRATHQGGRTALHRSFSSSMEQQHTLSLPRNHTLMSPGSPSRGVYSPYGNSGELVVDEMYSAARSPRPGSTASQTGGPVVPPRPPERSFQSSAAGPTSPFLPPPQYGRNPMFDNGYNPITPPPPSLFRAGPDIALVDDQTRIRMEQVERQLASLTGLVQTALTASATVGGSPSVIVPRTSESDALNSTNSSKDARPETNGLVVMTDLLTVRNPEPKTPRLGIKSAKDKCVSFEKSVSFCEDPVDLLEGKHSPQPTESKPAKPAIKSTTLPRASSQGLLASKEAGLLANAETFAQLRLLQKQARDLRQEMRNLKRVSQAQSTAVRDAVKDTIHTMKKLFLVNSDVITQALSAPEGDSGAIENSLSKIHRKEEAYQREMRQLEKDLSGLEILVEDLRSNVINKKTRVSMADVEQLAVLLSQSSKSVADLKTQYPALEESIKNVLTYQMGRLVEEERFLAEEPSKLENTMRRCKKLTSTLVTLRRLASVQEQRQPNHISENKTALLIKSHSTPSDSSSEPIQSSPPQLPSQSSTTSQGKSFDSGARDPGFISTDAAWSTGRVGGPTVESTRPVLPPRPRPRYENPFDALLDELKLYSHPSGDEEDRNITTPDPPPRRKDQLPPPPIYDKKPTLYAESSVDSFVSPRNKRQPPPPPPPRTASSFRSSASLASSSPSPSGSSFHQFHSNPSKPIVDSQPSSHSSSSESINSQEGLGLNRNEDVDVLDSRHQELLRKQKELQDQYARLQNNLQQQRPTMAVMGISALHQQHGGTTTTSLRSSGEVSVGEQDKVQETDIL